MKNLKKVIALICMLGLVGSFFVGCGSKEATQTQEQTQPQQTETQKPVEIAFWEQDEAAAQEAFKELIAKFEAENTGIKVTRTHYETEVLRQNFTTAAIGTTGPDIVFGPNDNLGVFVPGNLVQPIDELMGADFFKTLDSVSVEGGKYTGKQYLIPDRNGNELVLVYNKKLSPEAPKTFEDLIALSKSLKKEKKVVNGLVFNKVEPFFIFPFFGAFGGQIFDDVNAESPKITMNTEATKKWMQFIKKLNDEQIIPKDCDVDVANNMFKEGKAAFIITGPWEFNNFKTAGIDFGIASIPTIEGKYPQPFCGVKGYMVSASVTDNAKKEAVKKFLEFMNSKESQIRMAQAHKQLPTNIEAASSDEIKNNEPWIAAQQEPLSHAVQMPVIPQLRAFWDSVKPVQQKVFNGQIKPEDAPAAIQKAAEDILKNMGL